MSFTRTGGTAYIKLGSRQKSMLKYKKARGRHSKIRQKEKGRPVKVEIGFRNKNTERCLINGKMPVLVNNVYDLKKIGKNNAAIIGSVGMKNKIEIAKEAHKNKIEVLNLNLNKFLETIEAINKKKKPEAKK